MAYFISDGKPRLELYRLLSSCIVPRPIAWVSTRSRSGQPNLAPFSFFNGVTSNPPTLAFTVMDRGEEMKDTARNIAEHPEFIVHIVTGSMARQMNQTSGDFAPEVDEFEQAGLSALPGSLVDVPRVAEAAIAMECRLSHHLRLGNSAPQASHILGEIVAWHVRDDLLGGSLAEPVDPVALDAVGRMGGEHYIRSGELFGMSRPVIGPDDPRSLRHPRRRTGGPRENSS